MTYVISNIHGNYEKFKKLLADINFKDSDIMYILGDIVDHGEDPIGLIFDVSMRYNVLPILGEADYNAIPLLGALDKMLMGSTPDGDALAKMAEWMQNGGATTIEGFKALDSDMREGVLDYLSDMTLYEEVTVKGKNYLLLHAGISDFDPDASLEDYMPEDFITTPASPSERYFDDTTLIVGHIPTSELGGNNKILYGENTIHIDCGVAFDGSLACLRLEDGKEFYA